MSIESTYPISSSLTHEPHSWEFLTQSELQACYAIAFVSTASEYLGSYPLGPYLDAGSDDDWTSLVRAATRYLALEHGYLFTGLRVDLNHTIYEDRVVCPGNMISVAQGRAGKLPIHPLAALRNTVEWARERVPSLNLEPMLATISDIQESLKVVREAIGKEELEREAQLRLQAVQEFNKDGKDRGWI